MNIFEGLSPEQKQQLKSDANTAKGLGGIGGAFMMGDVNNVGSQAMGGALSGFSAGGPMGALIGLGAGLIGGLKRKSERQGYSRMMFDNMISTKTTDPSYYAKSGGMIMPIGKEEAIRTQANKGEKIALPTRSIVDVHSEAQHKDIKKDKVTDYIPVGSWIADTETEITKEEADKIILGANPGVYKEYEDGPKQSYKEIKLSDPMKGRDKVTAAEFLELIKDYVPVPRSLERGEHNPFASETAKENLHTRGKFISGLIELVAKKNKLLRKQLENL